MSHSKNPFVRGYDGLSVQRLLAISYDDDCPLSYLPLHVSQSHLPDNQVERHACVFCDDFALITEGQNVPPELDAQCPSHGIARNLVYAVMAEEAGQPLHVGDTYSEEAAREASTGNVALGNTSFENSTVLTRQFAQGMIAPSFTYGAAQTRTFSESGSMTTSFPEGSYDQVPNSSYPFTPSLGQEFTARLSTMASQARSNSETYANVATESTASAVTRFRELRDQFSRGSAFESTTGTSNSDSIQTAFSEVDQASTNLQRQFGLSRRAADDISTAWFLGGEAGASDQSRPISCCSASMVGDKSAGFSASSTLTRAVRRTSRWSWAPR